jgi:hypothetical protein
MILNTIHKHSQKLWSISTGLKDSFDVGHGMKNKDTTIDS